MPNLNFTTQVSGDVNGEFFIRGEKHIDLIASHSFVETLYFELTGVMPTAAHVTILDAILVACIDHGIAPASGFVPRVVAASGNEMTHAIAAGILALGPNHGGAIEAAGLMFDMVLREKREIKEFVTEQRLHKQTLYGFGHRVYKESDPRTTALFDKADAVALPHTYRVLARRLEAVIGEVYGKKLVLNIDGALAALILDLGLPIAAGNGLFALARVGGMIPHILEEYVLHSPVRRLDDAQITYREE